MSHLDAIVIGEGIEKNKTNGPKNTFFRILRRVQIGVLIIGTLLFLAWCCSYLIHEPPTERHSYATAEQLIALEDCCGAGDKAEHKENVESGMLPGNVVPHHYNLTLQLFMFPKYNFTTKGNVQIFIECLKETKIIVLHARDLTIESATVIPADESIESNISYSTNVSADTEKQQVLIQLDKVLKPQSKYLLEIPFQGIINNISVGLYRSSYLSDNGTASWIASTQFEPSDARRVFPCFDEPALKATIQFNLICQRGSISLSNMPVNNTEPIDEEWEIVTFMETPRMSTYTFSIVVGDIEPYTNEKERERGIQIWSRNDMVQYGELAHNITPVLLKYLEEYIEVPFTMPKLDLVSVPIFLHAAMENWGLIIFEESALLYDPEKSSTENKVFVTLVIAHELAHQWFGNLVTASWWDNIWLNEGFATYYEYIAVDRLQPQWNIMHVFIATIYEVMESDSMLSTRAIGSTVHPDEVLASFDEISYLKGGAIVRMLQHFIGEEGFRIGLKNYLWRYSYKSATEFDLWQNLNLWNRNKHGIKQVMTTWTRQSGYPVAKFERDYENRTATLTQKPFTILLDDPEESTKIEDERIWSIPVTFTYGSELDWSTKTDFWFTTKSEIIKDLPDENTWFIANVQQVGYYRVNYDSDNWNLILEQLLTNHTVINVINRAQILSDILNLARSDDVEYALALNMTKYLFLEEDYLPWQSAFTAFKYLDIMLAKTPGHDEFKEYLLAIMTPLYESLGWSSQVDKEDITTVFLRKNVLKWSCNYDHPGCVKKALAMFQNWKQESTDNQTLSADDREIVLCTGIARGPTDDWELMWKRYLGSNFKAEKNTLLKSLACTRETRLLRRLLKRAMDPKSGIPQQDGSDVFVYVAENFYGRDIVYDFFKRHMDEISFKFGSFAFAAGTLVDRVTASLNTENEIEELQSILKGRKTSVKEINKSLKYALHRSKTNVKWMKNNYDNVFSWLRENKAL